MLQSFHFKEALIFLPFSFALQEYIFKRYILNHFDLQMKH